MDLIPELFRKGYLYTGVSIAFIVYAGISLRLMWLSAMDQYKTRKTLEEIRDLMKEDRE